jgi:response regulator of citrate/malate metabolism
MKDGMMSTKKEFNTVCRLDMSLVEYELLKKLLESATVSEEYECAWAKDDLLKKVQNIKQFDISGKIVATKKANEKKQETSRKKVENAMNMLRMENKEITAYAVAKVAGISYNTASKYLKLMNEIK